MSEWLFELHRPVRVTVTDITFVTVQIYNLSAIRNLTPNEIPRCYFLRILSSFSAILFFR